MLREIGDRIIIQFGNQIIVESNDRPRMSRGARDVYYEDLPRGRTRETDRARRTAPSVVTIRNRYGDVIRRSRITPDGREYVLVYVDDEQLRRASRDWRDPGLDLPPMRLDIPVEEYILDADDVDDPDDYYDFLEQPPVERVERLYSVDEVKRSARIRDKTRRVDLDTLTFEFGSADDRRERDRRSSRASPRRWSGCWTKNPAETFLIEGHTDAVGSDVANLALSDRRAEAVADALTNVFGIPPENLATQGYGEQYLKVQHRRSPSARTAASPSAASRRWSRRSRAPTEPAASVPPRDALNRRRRSPHIRPGFPAPSRLCDGSGPTGSSRPGLHLWRRCRRDCNADPQLPRTADRHRMKRLELAIESIILASRWLLVVFYLGLGAGARRLCRLLRQEAVRVHRRTVFVLDDTDTILKMLGLIDAALVASLVVMVIISGYENFVSRFDREHEGEVHWLGTIDVGSLKIKVASTIVAISSIHLLQIFLNADLHQRPADVADPHAPGLRGLGAVPGLYRQARGEGKKPTAGRQKPAKLSDRDGAPHRGKSSDGRRSPASRR